jgi:hypothetical protein
MRRRLSPQATTQKQCKSNHGSGEKHSIKTKKPQKPQKQNK